MKIDKKFSIKIRNSHRIHTIALLILSIILLLLIIIFRLVIGNINKFSETRTRFPFFLILISANKKMKLNLKKWYWNYSSLKQNFHRFVNLNVRYTPAQTYRNLFPILLFMKYV